MKSTKCSVMLILMAFLSAFFFSYALSDGALAIITKVKGAPQIIKSGAADAGPIKIGETVEYGDTIITDSDSKATLVFNDGEIRIITSGSSVKFSAGDSNEQLTKVAKITATLAEAVNAQNLDNTFVSVTGIKLSMSGAGAEKKKALEAMPEESGIMREESSKSLSDNELAVSGGAAKEDLASFDKSAIPGGMPEIDAPSQSRPAPAPAPPPSTVAGSAPQPQSVDGGSTLSRPASGGDSFRAKREPAAKPVVSQAVIGGRTAEAQVADWGRWFDDANSLPWAQLMTKEIFDNLEKITFHSASSSRLDAADFSEKISLAGINDKIVKITVSFKMKKGAAADKSFRAQLIIDNDIKNKTAEELKKIEHLKTEDMETYLYLKAGIFKQNEFYIAALAALCELEKLQPGVKMPHVLKSKAIIYFKMGEKELSKAASDKLLK